MTPAKLLALEEERDRVIELVTFPIDKLAWMYANSKRDPGETDGDGRVVRPPADALDIAEFRTYGRRVKSLAAKDHWDSSLYGARANKDAWQSWAGNNLHEEFVPTPAKEQ